MLPGRLARPHQVDGEEGAALEKKTVKTLVLFSARKFTPNTRFMSGIMPENDSAYGRAI